MNKLSPRYFIQAVSRSVAFGLAFILAFSGGYSWRDAVIEGNFDPSIFWYIMIPFTIGMMIVFFIMDVADEGIRHLRGKESKLFEKEKIDVHNNI